MRKIVTGGLLSLLLAGSVLAQEPSPERLPRPERKSVSLDSRVYSPEQLIFERSAFKARQRALRIEAARNAGISYQRPTVHVPFAYGRGLNPFVYGVGYYQPSGGVNPQW